MIENVTLANRKKSDILEDFLRPSLQDPVRKCPYPEGEKRFLAARVHNISSRFGRVGAPGSAGSLPILLFGFLPSQEAHSMRPDSPGTTPTALRTPPRDRNRTGDGAENGLEHDMALVPKSENFEIFQKMKILLFF